MGGVSTMSPETAAIQRADQVLVAMRGNKTEWCDNQMCQACRKVNRCCLKDDMGHVICADCLPSRGQYLYPPTRVPQGDELLRLPYRPQFTKRFT